jgi:polyphosphate kinase
MDAPAKPPVDLYINRELSQLEFNKRVFAQAEDAFVPLLERLRFLCITCTNLDEFFEIRVAVLKQQIELGAPTQGADKLTAQQVFGALRHEMLALVQQQYQLLNDVLIPMLPPRSHTLAAPSASARCSQNKAG